MRKKFVSIIWGYHKQMDVLSPFENYHLHAISSAIKAGYECEVMMVDGDNSISSNPNLPSSVVVNKYSGVLSYVLFLLRNRCSVVYANSFVWQSFLVPLVCSSSIFMGHDSVMRKNKLKQVVQNFVFRLFKRIRVVTEEEKNYLINQGIDAEKISVLPLVVDGAVFYDQKRTNRSNFVFLGNVTPDKNIKTILEAFSIVTSLRENIKLIIIGEVRDDSFYVLLENLGITESVTVRGFIPHSNLCDELNACAVYVNSSISEGQCLAAYEAALCGLSLCLPWTLSFSGVFGDSALFHGVYDSRKLADNMMSSLNVERHKEIERAKGLVLAKCNYETIETEEVKLFKSVWKH